MSLTNNTGKRALVSFGTPWMISPAETRHSTSYALGNDACPIGFLLIVLEALLRELATQLSHDGAWM